MALRRLAFLAAVLGVAGCTPYIMKDDVVGPHGEQLVELACASPDDCMPFARQVCQGDFDIVTNDYTQPHRITIGGANDVMIVHCENSRGGSPAAPHLAAPDAGP